MSETLVGLELVGDVARVTLDRPEHGNAIDLDTARELGRVLQLVAADDAAHVVLLTGAGAHFCVGGDVRAMAAADDRGAFVLELARAAHEAVRTMAAMAKPVVASVRGSAAGAGLSLLLLADYVIAASDARLLTAYTSVGLSPDCGQSWLLPRAVGIAQAVRLTLEPAPLTAGGALDLGLVTEVVAGDILDATAHDVAQRLASGPHLARGMARALIHASYVSGFDDHLDREAATIAELAATPESVTLVDHLSAKLNRAGD